MLVRTDASVRSACFTLVCGVGVARLIVTTLLTVVSAARLFFAQVVADQIALHETVSKASREHLLHFSALLQDCSSVILLSGDGHIGVGQ